MGIQERKEREKEQRKAVIMACATKIFLAKGFVNATMEDIAVCSELSKATLYVYFKNKEEIILHVMNAVLCRLTELMETSMSRAKSAPDKISLIVEAYMDFYSDFNAQYELLSSQESTAGMDFVSLECYKDYVAQYNKFWDTLCAPVNVALEDGYFSKEFSAVEIAVTLWSTIKGLMQNMDKVVKTQNCPDYQKMVAENKVNYNDFQTELLALDYKKMLRHLSDSVIKSFQQQ
ncbi:MAG: hypothetical protein CVU50_09395 [Candidatus Cloacimonetes bacterium HGW-Cloacimonetes-3]|jgi:AcrR family transcriptional regulator|nr:MAG: hypothetical protein CVU50_09395 [Candidatus Cloacimonetes bacterium HGW-Cloacimonetes-3]